LEGTSTGKGKNPENFATPKTPFVRTKHKKKKQKRKKKKKNKKPLSVGLPQTGEKPGVEQRKRKSE